MKKPKSFDSLLMEVAEPIIKSVQMVAALQRQLQQDEQRRQERIKAFLENRNYIPKKNEIVSIKINRGKDNSDTFIAKVFDVGTSFFKAVPIMPNVDIRHVNPLNVESFPLHCSRVSIQATS